MTIKEICECALEHRVENNKFRYSTEEAEEFDGPLPAPVHLA